MASIAVDRPVVQKFIEALLSTEENHDPAPLVTLFSDDCSISNIAIPALHGKDGAQRFWRDYCSQFLEIRTTFTRATEAGDRVFLEWISEGVFPSGKPMKYEGLTILELEGDQVKGLRAYYDSAVFLKEGSKHTNDASSGLDSSDQPTGAETSSGQIMESGPDRDRSTPGEGVLTSKITDRDAATG